MQHNPNTAFEEQLEALRNTGDLDGLLRLKARLTDDAMIAKVNETIDGIPVIGLA